MSRSRIEHLARELLHGAMALEEFVRAVSDDGASIDQVTLDLDRPRRCGFPEVIYGEGKSIDSVLQIVDRLVQEPCDVLATRIDQTKGEAIIARFPAGHYNPTSRTFRLMMPGDHQPTRGQVSVVTAGTSDAAVAEEACETLHWMRVGVELIHDVGVAGPQRLVAHLPRLRASDAVVVVAGMEGALPSVVGGHVPCPVVAVPTSVGYGAGFGGIAALLGMLNSCASNVTVVNIDAGFKGGFVAGLIARRTASHLGPEP